MYLVGLSSLEHMAGHLGLGVFRLAADEVGEVAEVVAVVDEPRYELRLVLEYEDGRVAAVGRHAADDGRGEGQLDRAGLSGSGLGLLASPADLRHQPRQHGQGGPPVQRAPAQVPEREALIRLAAAAGGPFVFIVLFLHLLLFFFFSSFFFKEGQRSN